MTTSEGEQYSPLEVLLAEQIDSVLKRSMKSAGKLLIAQTEVEARKAAFEYCYLSFVGATLEGRRGRLAGEYGDEELDSFEEQTRSLKRTLESGNWSRIKEGVVSGVAGLYEGIVYEDEDFDLTEQYGLQEGYYVDGIPVLVSADFVTKDRQCELFRRELIRRVNLIPGVFSPWVHPELSDFEREFEV